MAVTKLAAPMAVCLPNPQPSINSFTLAILAANPFWKYVLQSLLATFRLRHNRSSFRTHAPTAVALRRYSFSS
jgi:hypothetical protein